MLWTFRDCGNGHIQFINIRTRLLFNRTDYTCELAHSLVQYLNQR